MKNQSTHALLLALVGGYILYIAWHLLDNLLFGMQDIPQAVAIAAIAVFALAGIAVLIYAWRTWQSTKKKDDEIDLD